MKHFSRKVFTVVIGGLFGLTLSGYSVSAEINAQNRIANSGDKSVIRMSGDVSSGSLTYVGFGTDAKVNEWVPIGVDHEIRYKAASGTLDYERGKAVNLNEFTHDGVSLKLKPSLIADGKIQVLVYFSVARLVDMKQIKSHNLTVDAPEIETLQFVQKLVVDNGVLTKFKFTNQDNNSNPFTLTITATMLESNET